MKVLIRVSKGTSEFILIAGYAGIGKSRLVQEIHKPILEKKGWFISGKFDKIREKYTLFRNPSGFSRPDTANFTGTAIPAKCMERADTL